MGSSSTVTILFTDVVGSTELLARLGDRADGVRRTLFAAIRKAVTKWHGEEVKSLGDGLMVAFTSAVDAVSCAVAAQQAVARLDRRETGAPLQIRVGASVGEATTEDGDYFGTPVVEAARLCAAAQPGQVLVSDLMRALVGSRSGHRFESVGRLELKGLGEPVGAWEVGWDVAIAEMPLPPTLELSDRQPIVGRDEAQIVLESNLERAAEGVRRAVLVAGEPGIGKTRLVAAVAATAHGAGTNVLYGRCDADLGVPYQPFTEALRHLVEHCEAGVLAAHVDVHAGELLRLVPDLARRLPGTPSPKLVEPEGDRLRLFEAVDGLLADASRDTPLMLVLDDLHWAARPTLLLLCHLVRSLRSAGLLIVGTYRDTEVDNTQELTAALGDLRRQPSVDRLHLSGLDQAGVFAYCERLAGHALDEPSRVLATVVHAETEGNPFFVRELLRHLAETGAVYQREGIWTSESDLALVGIPEGVREVVRGRLSRLSTAANRVLTVASVIGTDFGPDLLEQVGEAGTPADILDGIDEAARARLIVELPDAPCRYAFAHAIVRQTLYRELTSARRAVLHRRVGEALEQLHGPDGPHVPSLAHHFGQAAIAGHSAKAADYALRAARAALDQVAHEEAATLLQRGLAAIDADERADPNRRCDLMLALAEVHLRALDAAAVREVSLAAARLARELGSPERLAQAACWYGARGVAGQLDQVGIDLCEEALDALGDGEPVHRARVLSVLALQLAYAGKTEEADSRSQEALALAAETDDAEALGLARYGRYQFLWGSERAADQLALAEQLRTSTVITPSGWLASVDAHRLVTVPRLILGDYAGFLDAVAEVERLGRRLKSRYFLALVALWKGCRALLEGQFADFEAATAELARMGADDENFQNAFAGQMFQLSFERGRLGSLKPFLSQVIERTPGLAGFHAALALAHVEHGETDEARRLLDELATDGFAAVPRDLVWPGAMAILCEAAAALEDAGRAATLAELFRPYSGQLVVVANGSYCPGAVDRYLGMVLATTGRFEEAEALFRSGLELEERIGALPLVARSRYWYARLLLARLGPGDQQQAAGLLSAARTTATQLGMPRLAREAEALGTGVSIL
ncbi:MAG: AAA family ATPase [Acidimicrobiales bacterium]